MTPEQRIARQNAEINQRLYRTLVDDEVPDISDVESNPLFSAIPDKKAAVKNAAVAAWMDRLGGTNIIPGTVEWQPAKDALVQSFFRQPAAKNVSDEEVAGLIKDHLVTQSTLLDEAFVSAAKGIPLSDAVRQVQDKAKLRAPNRLASKSGEYLAQFAKEYQDTQEKLFPYQDTIAQLAEMGRNAEKQIAETNIAPWEDMARLMLHIPAEDRPDVLAAVAAQGAPEGEEQRNFMSRLALEFGRGAERLVGTARQGLPDIGLNLMRIGMVAPGAESAFNLARAAGAAVGAESDMPSRVFIPEEQQQLDQLANQMRDISRQALEPLAPVRALGMNISGAASNLPMTAAALVPYVGPAVLLGSFKAETEYQLRQQYPEMTSEQIEGISSVAAPIQAVTEVISDRLLFGRLPNFARFINSPAFKPGTIAGQLAARVGVGGVTEYTEELAQDLTPQLLTGLTEALTNDVPGVNWGEFWREWKAGQGELIATIMPLVLLGSGVGQVSDYQNARALARNRDLLVAAGYSPENADKIKSFADAGQWQDAQDLMLSDWRKVNAKGAPVSSVGAEAAQKIIEKRQAAREKVAGQLAQVEGDANTLLARAGYNMRRTAQGWEVTTPEATVVVATAEEATALLETHFDATERENILVVAKMADTFAEQKQNETIEIQPGTQVEMTVQDNRSAIEVAARMNGLTPEQTEKLVFAVLGRSTTEIAEGMRRPLSQIFEGGNVLTMVEETVEGRFKRAIETNVMTREQAREMVLLAESVINEGRAEKQVIYDATASNPDRALIEAVSRIVVLDVLGRRKDGSRIAPGLVTRGLKAALNKEGAGTFATMLTAFRRMFGSLFSAARALRKARADGRLGKDYDAFVNGLLGVSQEAMDEQATLEIAQEIAAEMPVLEGQPYETFSVAEQYGYRHRPNETGPRAFDLSEEEMMPADVYDHPEWYSAMSPKVIQESMAQLRRVRGKPNGKVTIYRAGPKGEMNRGDWVSLSREYAKTHAMSQDPGEYKVWSAEVAASDVRWDMNDIAEFGYFGDNVTAKETGVTFSIVPNFQQRLSSVFSPLMRDPAVRRELAKRALDKAKKQVAKLGNVKLSQIEQENADRLQENLLEIDAELRADLDEIRQERDFELAGAKEDKAGKLAEEKIKRNADNKIAARRKKAELEKAKLESDFAATSATSERTARQEQLLAALRTLNAALGAMPPLVRTRVGGFIAIAQRATPEGMMREIERRIAKMDKELERFLADEATTEAEKLFDRYKSQKDAGGRKAGKLLSDATEQIDFALSTYDMDTAQQDALIAGYEKIIRESDNAEEVQDALNRLAIAELFSSWGERDAEYRFAAVEWMRGIIETGKLGRSILDEERKAFLAELKTDARKAVVGDVRKTLTDAENTDNQTKSSAWKDFVSKVKATGDSLLWTTAQQLEILFGENSKVYQYFSDAIVTAANKSTDIKIAADQRRMAFLETLFDSKSAIVRTRAMARLQKARKSGVFVNPSRTTETVTIPVEVLERLADGKVKPADIGLNDAQAEQALEDFAASGPMKKGVDVEKVVNAGEQVEKLMSEAQGIMWLLWSRQEASRKQMERDGWTDESFAQLNEFLSPEAKAIADWMAEEYSTAADLIDPVYRRLFNAPLPRIKDYAPIYRERPGDTNVMQDNGNMNSSLEAGFTKARVNANSPLRQMDAFVAFLSHWEHVSHWVSYAEVVRDLKAVALDSSVQNAIRSKSGSGALENVKNRIKAIENNGNKAAWDMHSLNALWSRLVQYKAFKGLAFRISPIVKQTSGLLNPLLADVPAPAYAAGLARAFGQPVEFAKEVAAMWNSQNIQRRLDAGFSAEARIAMSGAGLNTSTLVAAMQKGMAPMSLTDAGWNAIGAAIAFRYYKRTALREEGTTEEQANVIATKQVEKMLATAAQPADMVNRALVENQSNPFVKSLWMFASESRKALAIELMAIRRIAKGKDISLNLQRVLVAHVIQAGVTQLMAGFLAYLMGDEEDREREWSVEQWAAALALGPINGLFVLGSVIDMGFRRLLGLRTFKNDLLVTQAFDTTERAIKNMDELFNDDPDSVLDEIDRLSAAAGAVMTPIFGPAGGAADVFLNVGRDVRKIIKAQAEED